MSKRNKYFLLLLLIFPSLSFTQIYVSPTGNDSNDGSIDYPYQTIQKALSVVSTGGLIYLREGIYNNSTTIQTPLNGLPNQEIKLWAYPGETVILDFSLQPYSSSSRGLYISRNYWSIKGLIIRYAGDNGIYITGSNNTVENCTFYENKDTGLQISGGGSYNIITNCDSYENYDSLTHGENADGFAAKLNIGLGNEFHKCRAWGNSDDGWDLFEGQNPVIIDSCWAFHNGYNIWGDISFQGDGNGIKVGGNYVPAAHRVTHSITFDNKAKGFDQNHNTAGIILYNNTAWRNGGNNFAFAETPSVGKDTLINNISFSGSISINAGAVQITNSWSGFTVTNDDFISLDTSLAKAPRDSIGNLPTNNFLKLTAGSDLIDSGYDVGFPYNGGGPDLGAFESGSQVVLFTIIASAGENGQINPWGIITIPQGDDTTFVIIPDQGYHVDSVIVDNDYVGSDTFYTFTNIQQNHIIRVTFAINLYTLTVIATNGFVNKYPDYPEYEFGSYVELYAIPHTGYRFIRWSGDADGSENPITITMDSDKNITANFGQDSLVLTVHEGWNMISFPLIVADTRKDKIFPSAVSDAFIYDGTYIQRESIKTGLGYWIRFSQQENISIWGTYTTTETVNVFTGWNIIGSVGTPISVQSILSDPPGMITSPFLTYLDNYVQSDTILPGKGYWVKVNQPGVLVLGSDLENKPEARIKITFSGDTPPPPPGEGEVTVKNGPSLYFLEQNYPNPFNPVTNFRFRISNGTNVKLKIIDINGKDIVTLIDSYLPPGSYSKIWDASGLSSGVYYYKLITENFEETRKMIILK